MSLQIVREWEEGGRRKVWGGGTLMHGHPWWNCMWSHEVEVVTLKVRKFLGTDSIASSLLTNARWSTRPYRSSHHGKPNDKRKGKIHAKVQKSATCCDISPSPNVQSLPNRNRGLNLEGTVGRVVYFLAPAFTAALVTLPAEGSCQRMENERIGEMHTLVRFLNRLKET